MSTKVYYGTKDEKPFELTQSDDLIASAPAAGAQLLEEPVRFLPRWLPSWMMANW